MNNLLSSDDESVEGKSEEYSDVKVKVNRRFAESFEKREKLKDLERYKQLALDEEDDDDSDDESEDDDAEELSSAMELKIINTINSIRKKDPNIYDKSKIWFEALESDSDDDDDEDHVNPVDKKKKFKDVIREQLLADESEEGSDDEDSSHGTKKFPNLLSYDKEQEKLRQSFLQSSKNIFGGKDSEGHEDNDDDDILVVKERTPAELAQDEEDLKQALHEMKTLGKQANKGSVTVDEDRDNFLADYITNKKWKSDLITYADEKLSDNDNEEEGEEEADAAELFESKYNFRFEELGGGDSGNGGVNGLVDAQVVGHSRTVEGSMRRSDDKRKVQREQRAEKKDRERRQKEAEMRRLKNLKRQELQERLRKISEVGGLGDLGLDESALDEDWDPEKHEEIMRQQFNSGYYDAEDDAFNVDNQEIDQWLIDEIDENYAEEELDEEEEEASVAVVKGSGSIKGDKGKGKAGGMDLDRILDHGAKSSKLAANMLDELYQLDYEDIVAGIPCRFKYKQVEAEDYGLTTEDILMADDFELNKIVSLKRLATYNNKKLSNDEYRKVKKQSKKLRSQLKERAVKQQEGEGEEGGEVLGGVEGGLEEKVGAVAAVVEEKQDMESGDANGKKKRKRRKKVTGSADQLEGVDEETDVEMEVGMVVGDSNASASAGLHGDISEEKEKTKRSRHKKGGANRDVDSALAKSKGEKNQEMLVDSIGVKTSVVEDASVAIEKENKKIKKGKKKAKSDAKKQRLDLYK